MVLSTLRRTGCAIAIGAAGGVLTGFTGELAGLLLSVAAVSLHGTWWMGLLSVVIFALIEGAILLPTSAETSDYIKAAALLVAALGIWTLIQDSRRLNAHDGIERDARLLVENMPGLGWFTDAKGRILYLNPSTLDYVGVTTEEIDRRRAQDAGDVGWRELVHPEDADQAIAQWQHSVSTGERYECEQRIRRFDGAYRWFRASAVAARDSVGRITGWYGTTIDIDEQKKAEMALRESEQQLRRLIDTVPALIWCATPQGEPCYINKPLINYAGLVLEDFDVPDRTRLAEAIQSVVHPDDKAAVQASLMRSFTTGEPFTLRYRQRRADGVYRWTDGRAEALYDQSGAIVQWYGVCFDIDDEVRSQEALRRAQDELARATQIASLAELSASIAHEINQPLTAVTSNAHACQRWLSASPPNVDRAQATVARIVRDAKSTADVISRIRALFKQAAPTKTPANINDVISEVCDLIADDASAKKVAVETDLDPSLPAIHVDQVQVRQVLINLVRNGIDAMELEDDGRLLRIRSLADNDMICVEVSDRGSGVKHPEKMFEPFFTTKESGMGMGLAICRSIIESHNGRLWVMNNEPRGTTLAFTLPVGANYPVTCSAQS